MATLQILGIRHHGPGSARALVRALDEFAPDIVLVELPADMAPVLPLAARPDMEPPVALLGYVRDAPERAAFWPLARFSPEWCAIEWAARARVPVEPIDLAVSHALAAGESASIARDPIADLAAAAGVADPERWWEDVVEHRGDGAPAFAAVAEAIAAVRGAATAADCVALETVIGDESAGGCGPPAPSVLVGSVVSLSDARREAHMRRAIRRAESMHERVAVVCGAWHVPALTPPYPSAAIDSRRLRGLPRVAVTCTWVPWTHRRLAAATGYAAGVQAPGWYAHVHEHPGDDGLIRWFALAGEVMRSTGRQASPDHLIAAVRAADALAALRGRPRAGLDEALDAAVAVVGEGRDTVLHVLSDRLVVGEAIGSVPDDTPMVPLARDVAARQRRCRLKPTAERRLVELDLRNPNGLARSHLLHQLAALHVPWGELVAGRGSSGSFRETWQLRWEPELSVLLVERSGHGTTLESAATIRLLEEGAGVSSVPALVELVEQALLADLSAAIAPLAARLAQVSTATPDLAELMDALSPLARTLRYGDARGSDAAGLGSLFDSLVVRIVAGLEPACHFLDHDASLAMAGRLTAVQAALALVDHDARADRWPESLERLVARSSAPLIAGRATRLLHDSGHWPIDRTTHTVRMWLGRGTPAASAAAFVEGVLGDGGTVLVYDHSLVDALDRWIASLDADDFTTSMVLLRRTFSAFEPADRRRLGEIVSGRVPVGALDSSLVWDPALAAAATRTLRHLWGVVA